MLHSRNEQTDFLVYAMEVVNQSNKLKNKIQVKRTEENIIEQDSTGKRKKFTYTGMQLHSRHAISKKREGWNEMRQPVYMSPYKMNGAAVNYLRMSYSRRNVILMCARVSTYSKYALVRY